MSDGLDIGLLAPSSVAVVGASDVPGSPGRQAVDNLVNGGFLGPVWPVNPRYETVAGLPSYPSLAELPASPDAVFVLVPAVQVPEILSAAADRGARLAIIASSGLGEGQDDYEGAALGDRIRAIAITTGLRLVGPNTEGFWNIHDRCFITLGSALRLMPPVRPGPVAVVSQSGSVGAALGWRLTLAGVGLSHVIMTGNELDIDVLEVCDAALDDPATTTIALFIEGLRDASRLKDIGAKAAELGKHLVALKTGNTTAAKLATLSHTGKFATDAAIYDAALRHAGVVRVDRLEQLVQAAAVLSRSTHRPRKGMAVIAVSGGSRSIVADAATARGVPIPPFAAHTEAGLRASLRSYSSTQNPCDVGGWSFSSVATAADLLRPVLDDPNTDTVLIQFASRGREESRTALAALADLRGSGARGSEKPVALSLLTDGPSEECAELAARLGVTIATDPTRAVEALTWLYREGTVAPVDVRAPDSQPTTRAMPWSESARWLAAAGLPTVPGVVVRGKDQLPAALDQLTAPGYVLKLHPDDAPHKTDVGGVLVGLRTAAEVAAGLEKLTCSPTFRGRALLQPQVPAMAEVVVSVFDDADFGAVVCVGSGGVDVETTPSKSYAVLPLQDGEAEALVRDSDALIAGRRKGRENDGPALVRLVEQLCLAFQDAPHVTSVELNPVMVGAPGAGAAIVDVLIETARHDSEEYAS
jgi:acetate---CoA ligase (ADP-forming)